jgi:hypothetical protein
MIHDMTIAKTEVTHVKVYNLIAENPRIVGSVRTSSDFVIAVIVISVEVVCLALHATCRKG